MNEANVIVRYETLRSLAFGGISGAYAAVGSTWNNPARIIKVNNATDANLLISFDGITNHDVVLSNSAYVLDYSSNKNNPGGQLDQSYGTRMYVKQESAAPTLGNVYLTVIYASAS